MKGGQEGGLVVFHCSHSESGVVVHLGTWTHENTGLRGMRLLDNNPGRNTRAKKPQKYCDEVSLAAVEKV